MIVGVSDAFLFFTLLLNAIAITKPPKQLLRAEHAEERTSSSSATAAAASSSKSGEKEEPDMLTFGSDGDDTEASDNDRNAAKSNANDAATSTAVAAAAPDDDDDDDDDDFVSVAGTEAPLLGSSQSIATELMMGDPDKRTSIGLLTQRATMVHMIVRRCGVLIALWNMTFMLAMLLIIP